MTAWGWGYGTKYLPRRRGVWSPADLPGFVLELAPSPQTCFSDDAGTIPCIDGSAVAVVRSSGGAILFRQTVSARRPTLLNLAGKWVIRLVRSSLSGMDADSTVALGSIGLASQVRSLNADTRLIQGRGLNGLIQPCRTGLAVFATSPVSTDSTPPPWTGTAIVDRPVSGPWRYERDGVNRTTSSVTSDWTGLAIGSGLYMESVDADVYSLIAAGSLDTQQRDLMRAYLQSKL
jgi:hypothetical protein